MPSRPFANSTMLEPLCLKVAGNNYLLLGAPAFLDFRIVVIRFCHSGSFLLRGREALAAEASERRSAPRRTERNDCTPRPHAEFAAAHGWATFGHNQ